MLGDLNDVLARLDKIEQARFIDEDGRALDLDRFDIAFEDVAFSYDEGPEARTVLHDVSFAIPCLLYTSCSSSPWPGPSRPSRSRASPRACAC